MRWYLKEKSHFMLYLKKNKIFAFILLINGIYTSCAYFENDLVESYSLSDALKNPQKIYSLVLDEDSICKMGNKVDFTNLKSFWYSNYKRHSITKNTSSISLPCEDNMNMMYHWKNLDNIYLDLGAHLYLPVGTSDSIVKKYKFFFEISSKIENLPKLKNFVIFCDRLGKIPKELSKLKKIVDLILVCKQIDGTLDPIFELSNLNRLSIPFKDSKVDLHKKLLKLPKLNYLRLDCSDLDDYSVLNSLFSFPHLLIQIEDTRRDEKAKNKDEWIKKYKKIKASLPDFRIHYLGSQE